MIEGNNPRKLLWLTLQQTEWYESEHKGKPILVRGYLIERGDGQHVNIVTTCLPSDAPLIRTHLDHCAALAIRSYDGCACIPGQCKAHQRVLDVKVWGKVPVESQGTGAALRAWVEAAPAETFLTDYAIFKGGDE